MSLKAFGVSIIACSGVLVSTLLVPSVSVAQADFPSSAGFRAGLGTHGTFDTNAKESSSIADLQEGDVYRICLVGGSGKLVVDGKEVPMDRGDCHDHFGKKFDFSADVEANGFYTHLVRDR